MKKILLAVVFLFFVSVHSSFAATHDFVIDADSSYVIDGSGSTSVVQNITVKNTTDFLFTPTYTANTGLNTIKSVKVVTLKGVPIPFEILSNASNLKSIQITFDKRTTGKIKLNQFTISYTTDSIAKHMGSIWQVAVPGVANNGEFEQNNIQITAPQSFGLLSVTKPYKNPSSLVLSNGTYHVSFSTQELNSSGVFLEFGDHQTYSLHLTYHLANPNFFPINSEMALPPSTDYQDITIAKLTPQPSTIRIDQDGNWIAIYKLATGQKLTVMVDGTATVYATPKLDMHSQDEGNSLTQPEKYWDSNGQLKQLAQQLKTPDNIYEYVKSHLTYDYTKVGKNNNRLGAQGVLSHPTEAVCLEFTDLYVAIARAAGIPARGIEGYGYTDNPTLKPISQTNDILHTWPEYFDEKLKKWIMVDPTWGNTSLGSDYFHSMDFEHIVFVKHGLDSTYPIPAGGYKYSVNSKDVNVSIASLTTVTPSVNGKLVDTLPSHALFSFPVYGQLLVQNTGNSLLRNVQVSVTSTVDGKQRQYSVPAVAPYGSEIVTVDLGTASFLTNRDYTVTIVSGTYQIKHTIHVGYFPQNDLLILGGVVSVGIIGLFIATTKARSLLIQKR